jgi:hypothetical protein
MNTRRDILTIMASAAAIAAVPIAACATAAPPLPTRSTQRLSRRARPRSSTICSASSADLAARISRHSETLRLSRFNSPRLGELECRPVASSESPPVPTPRRAFSAPHFLPQKWGRAPASLAPGGHPRHLAVNAATQLHHSRNHIVSLRGWHDWCTCSLRPTASPWPNGTKRNPDSLSLGASVFAECEQRTLRLLGRTERPMKDD